MESQHRCPNCKKHVAASGTHCEDCAGKRDVSGPASKPDQQAMMFFWIVSVLFVCGVVAGLSMLVPHMLK